MTAALQTIGEGERKMAGATKFQPDVTVGAKTFKIGCIGAGMIMAECHLAAYREAGFPVVRLPRAPEPTRPR